MDPRLLEKYNEELRFIREMGVEFSKRFPKVAGRLDLGSMDCADPYVERLLEGFAFLTARIQLKMDAEFPRFTQHLLEKVYPHYLAPTPSSVIVEFEPDLKGGVTEAGFELPRETELRSAFARKGHVSCEFRTAHAINLWPVRISAADYLPLAEAGRYADSRTKGLKSAIRLRLSTASGFKWNQLGRGKRVLDQLSFYLDGAGDLPAQLYELLIGHCLSICVTQGKAGSKGRKTIHRRYLQAQGFSEDEAMLPYGPASFSGYRLLQEYFMLPQRFHFVSLGGLADVVNSCDDDTLELVILLDEARSELHDLVDVDSFKLNCTPAINLFHRRADRIHLNHRSHEHHLVADRTRPRDYEVYSVESVTGFSSGSDPEQAFRPFYESTDARAADDYAAYFTLQRRPALAPVNAASGSEMRSNYLGSEVFISLVDAHEAPYRSDLKQLGMSVVCTNRHLPQYIPPGHGKTDFTLEIGAPVNSVRCHVGPTDPKASFPQGEYHWRLINHLSLNYLTLMEDKGGAASLRELLSLYGDFSDPAVRKQIEGLVNVSSRQIVRRLPIDGPMAYGRGVEISLSMDDAAYEGSGAFLFSAILEQFFTKYVSLNSFTQTVVRARERGEIMRWPVRTGTRTML